MREASTSKSSAPAETRVAAETANMSASFVTSFSAS